MSVRVRFAPSPTGPLHMGGVRTALYNYLFARKHKGTFILRIEDTDQARYVAGAEDYIQEALSWCGLELDEGPQLGGEFGPYRQSERKDLYEQYALQLINSGWAYYAFDTPEEIEAKRKEAQAAGQHSWQYDMHTRSTMRNSEVWGPEKTAVEIAAGTPYVIRFKIPSDRSVTFTDMIRGDVSYDTNVLDDKVIFKSDGMPTYHMANVIDDYLMKITHVIRGEEWVPSTPLHVLLYEALGWENSRPEFGHLPLILKPEGSGKLSKRDGDKLGFPVFPLEWKDPKTGETSSGYREQGYFPDAFINMILMLGWNPGTEQELFSHDEMIQTFSMDRVIKSGARFSPDKARWYNEQYMRAKTPEELALAVAPFSDGEIDPQQLARICELMAQRATLIPDLLSADYLVNAPKEYDEKTLRKKWKDTTPALVELYIEKLKSAQPATEESFDQLLQEFVAEKEIGFGQIGPALRLLLTGLGGGPSLPAIMAFLGCDEVVRRMETGLQNIAHANH